MDMGWVIQAVIYLNVFLVGVLITIGIQQWRAHRRVIKSNSAVEMLPEKVRDEVIDNARKHYQRAVYKTAIELDHNLAATNQRLNESLEKLRTSISKDEGERYNEALKTIRDQAAKIVGSTASEIQAHQQALRQHFEQHQKTLDAELEKQADATKLELQKQRSDYQQRQASFEAQLAEHQRQIQAALEQREMSLDKAQSELETKLLEIGKRYVLKQQQLEASLDEHFEARRAQLAGTLETELADTILAFLADALGSSADLSATSAPLVKLLETHKEELLAGVKK
jgi:hypothetical protein